MATSSSDVIKQKKNNMPQNGAIHTMFELTPLPIQKTHAHMHIFESGGGKRLRARRGSSESQRVIDEFVQRRLSDMFVRTSQLMNAGT